MSKIRVVVADDHIYATEGMHKIIVEVAKDDMELIGETTDVNEVIPLVERTQPDVLVLDLAWMGDKKAGVRMIPQVFDASPQTRVVAITFYPELLELAQQSGAHAALGKGFSIDDLLGTIRWVARSRNDPQKSSLPNGRELQPLTDREREVLDMLVLGAQDKEIARDLGISIGTCKKHVSNILGKLGANNRTEATSIANQYQLTHHQNRHS